MPGYDDEHQQSAPRLGEIVNESARDPYTRRWPGHARRRVQDQPYDLAPRAVAEHIPVVDGQDTAKHIEVTANVRATYDSRPVNAFDGIFTAIMTVA